jgi:hypothetical protein
MLSHPFAESIRTILELPLVGVQPSIVQWRCWSMVLWNSLATSPPCLEVCNYHDVIDYEGKVITLVLTLCQ